MNLFKQQLVLENEFVRLMPMAGDDLEGFCRIAFDEVIWKYMNPGIANATEMDSYLLEALLQRQQQLRYPFTIVDKQSGQIAGTTSFVNYSEKDARLEIGSTWLGLAFQQTKVNRAAKHLLLNVAFERLAMERVEFKTDVLNQKSRWALAKLGATEEGIFRSHMWMHDGRRRDSVYYSILRSEWKDLERQYFANVMLSQFTTEVN